MMNSHQYFNHIASDWEAIRHQYFKDDIRPWIQSLVDFSDKTVVDLGAGSGFISLAIAPLAKQVIAIDQSEKMLAEIEMAARHQHLTSIQTLQSRLEKIPLKEASVDVVIMSMALHHIEDPMQLIEEMHRILKPDGMVILSDVMEHEGVWAHEEMHDVWLGFSLHQIDEWLNQTGFEEVRVVNTQLRAIATSSKGEVIDGRIFMGVGRKGEIL